MAQSTAGPLVDNDPVPEFPSAHITEEVIDPIAADRFLRRRLLVTEGPFSAVRTNEYYRKDADGHWRRERLEAMLADSVLAIRPDGVTLEQFAALLAVHGLRAGPQYRFSPAVRAFLTGPIDISSVDVSLARLRDAGIGWRVEPDYIQFSDMVPDDYDGGQLWGLETVQAPVAWSASTGSTGVVAGIIDSGIDRHHPDLAANVWRNEAETANDRDDDGNGLVDDLYGWDFATNDNDPSDANGHGTHVAGIVGAVGNNGDGVVGVAWRVKLLALRCGDQNLATSSVIQALDYLSDLKRRGVPVAVVNNSYGSTNSISTQKDSIVRARQEGILFVAAAGNDGRDVDGAVRTYPVGYAVDNIVGVAALHQGGGLADYSNWGEGAIHLAAPGSGIWSTAPGGKYAVKDGTSMAAPMVTGALVLLKSLHPEIDYLEAKRRLLAKTVPVPALSGVVATGGRLDLGRLIAPDVGVPRISWLSPLARLVGSEGPTAVLQLGVHAVREIDGTENGTVPVAWEKVSGPGEVVFTAGSTPGTAVAFFPQVGLYQIKASAQIGALSASVEKTVAVGRPKVGADALLASWAFDEESGPALDGSGNGRTATLINGAVRDVGPTGLASMEFDGMGAAASFQAPAPARTTVVGWMYMDTKGNSVFPRLLHFPTYYLFPGRDAAVSPKAPDANRGTLKFLAHWSEVDGVYHSEPDLVTDGRWYHMAASYDGTRSAREIPRLYLDGRPLIVGTQAGAAGAFTPTQGLGYIGNNDQGTRALDGRLADVRVYGRELQPAEIALLAGEPSLDSVFAWELVVVSSTARSAVVQLRKKDGRVPGAGQGVGWKRVEGPGAATFAHASGGQVDVSVPASGLYKITVALTEGIVATTRVFELVLPGVPVDPVPPKIIRQPTGTTVAVGSALKLDVETSGSPPLEFQWFRDGTALAGATSQQLAIGSCQRSDAGRYTVKVGNSGGSVTSEGIEVVVLDPPSITKQPQNSTIAIGSRLELSVIAEGSPPLSYQWWHETEKLAGATAATFAIGAVGVSDGGSYSVTVTNPVGIVESMAAVVEVLEPPTIMTQPRSGTVVVGSRVQFDIIVRGAVPWRFQWYKDNQPISGATEPSLSFAQVKMADYGEYKVRVTNSVGEAWTDPFTLRIVELPTITLQPSSRSASRGDRVELEVVVSGTAPLTYQWFKGFAAISGADGPKYVIEKLQEGDVGSYFVKIGNEFGLATSKTVYVEMVVPPKVTRSPEDQVVAVGGSAVLSVGTETNEGAPFIRWIKDGVVLSSGTATQFQLSNIQPAQVGLYVAEVSSSGGTTLSVPAVVGVRPTSRTAGAVETRPEWQGIVHPNGNIYDQFLLTGAAGTITAEAGKIARLSFLDEDSDIVQVELSGAGAVTVCLAEASGPQAPLLYNQTGINYYQGKPTVVLVGADASTHMSIYSVGRLNNPGVTLPDIPYDGWADVRALGVVSADKALGGLYLGNVAFGAGAGPVGIVATTVRSVGTVRLHDVAATGDGWPHLRFAADGRVQVAIAGGSLAQANDRPVDVPGVQAVLMGAGSGSSGQSAPAQAIRGRLVRDGVDVTATIVVTAP